MAEMRYGKIEGLRLPVSRLIQGAMNWGAGEADATRRHFDGVFRLGCNTFDTAHVYGGGASERGLGQWIRERGVRDQVVIVDKGAHPDQGRPRVTPDAIAADLAESLDRLGTDRIDLYLLHRDDPNVPVGEIVAALDEHRRAGRVDAYGGSNWTAARLAEANAYATEHGLAQMAASSPNLSLAVPREVPWAGCVSLSSPGRGAERQWYAEQGMPILAWSSLAGGFCTGRFRRDDLDAVEDYFDQVVVRCYCTEENFARLDWARAAGEAMELSLAQVAVAWVLAQPLNVFALVGCMRLEEFAENLAALEAVDRLPVDAPTLPE